MSAQQDTVNLIWDVIAHELQRMRSRQAAVSPSNERLGLGVRMADDDLTALERLTGCICKLQESGAVATKADQVLEERVTARVKELEAEALKELDSQPKP